MTKRLTCIYETDEGFEIIVDGIKVPSTYNSRGAARAAIDVERRRREARALKQRSHDNGV